MSPRCSGVDRRVGVCVWPRVAVCFGTYFVTHLVFVRSAPCDGFGARSLCGDGCDR